ncbi:MAG TPA: FeoB-associated Cys-rich membrane protein [Cellvibrio sp.]|nr:FeoB-associated Cys-rich membrane protein [Cellvibrio sp.]
MWQDIPWQEVIVGVCVLTAVIFLVRRWIFPSAKKSAACGGCSGCAKTSESSCANPVEKQPH